MSAYTIGSFYPEDESHPEFFVILNRGVAAGPFSAKEEAVAMKVHLERAKGRLDAFYISRRLVEVAHAGA